MEQLNKKETKTVTIRNTNNFLNLILKSLFYNCDKNLCISLHIFSNYLPENIYEADDKLIYMPQNSKFNLECEEDIEKFISYIFDIVKLEKLEISILNENIKIQLDIIKNNHIVTEFLYTMDILKFNYILELIALLPNYINNIICTELKYTIKNSPLDSNSIILQSAYSKFNSKNTTSEFFKHIHTKMFTKKIDTNSVTIEITLKFCMTLNRYYNLIIDLL